ncbi:4-carboxymuconolactone decarboxylase [Ferrovibrio sp.]|uniref:4-carboxymuconolactone decarboxylase n=1 Tax=Ferrovibrio sp. TaxID=1917215 RepID=UPI0025BDD584|nr:4-carboxymuconolactone decarboxylase [Ferrovibrio sp.]MBX3453860.1 4-carboxymuconolactone decarboxylase [Ferrovibrio sp.]
MAENPSKYESGMAVRRKVLGDAHVDRAEAAKTDFDRDFQTFITETAWGSLWARPHWPARQRSIITITLLAALGQDEELAMHVRATRNTGATEDDLREAMLHVAVYAGVPVANHAIKIIKQTYDGIRAGESQAGIKQP